MQDSKHELDSICRKLLDDEANKIAWVELAKYILGDEDKLGDLPGEIFKILNAPQTYHTNSSGDQDLNFAFVCYINAVREQVNVPSWIWREIVDLIMTYSGSFCFEESFAEDFSDFNCEFYEFAVFCGAHAVVNGPNNFENWQSLRQALELNLSEEIKMRLCKRALDETTVDWLNIDDITDFEDFISVMLIKLNTNLDPSVVYSINRSSNFSRYSNMDILRNFPSQYRGDPAIMTCKMLLDGLAIKQKEQMPSWLKLIEYFIGSTSAFSLPLDVIPSVYRDTFGGDRSAQFQEICLQIIRCDPNNSMARWGLEKIIYENNNEFTPRVTDFFRDQGLGNTKDNILLHCLQVRLSALRPGDVLGCQSLIEFIWEHDTVFIPSHKMPDIYREDAAVIPELQPFLHLSRAWSLSRDPKYRSELLCWCSKFAERVIEKRVKSLGEVIEFILKRREFSRYHKPWLKIVSSNPDSFSTDSAWFNEVFAVFILLHAIDLDEKNAKAFRKLIDIFKGNGDGFYGIASCGEGDLIIDIQFPAEWFPRSFPKGFCDLSIHMMQMYFYSKIGCETGDINHLIEIINSCRAEEQKFARSCFKELFSKGDKSNEAANESVLDYIQYYLESSDMQTAVYQAFYGINKSDAGERVKQLRLYQKIGSEYQLQDISTVKVWCQNENLRNWIFWACYQLKRQQNIPFDVLCHITKFIIDDKLEYSEIKHLMSQVGLVSLGVKPIQARFFNNPALVSKITSPIMTPKDETLDEEFIFEEEEPLLSSVFDCKKLEGVVESFAARIGEADNFSDLNSCIRAEIAEVEAAKLKATNGLITAFFGRPTQIALAEVDNYSQMLESEAEMIKRYHGPC